MWLIILVSVIVLLVLDLMYLMIIKHHFNDQVKRVQGENIRLNYYGAAICYMILLFGLHYFILYPEKGAFEALLLGLVIYGVYESTNMAIFNDWTWYIFMVDTLWGGVLLASTTIIVQRIIPP